jgi:acetamidase/formamidase
VATHRFVPSVYHGTLGSHEPVLEIASGDTVATTTIDAWGRDATGERVTTAVNAQTGPFWVEGADPGDTLAVRIDSIRPTSSVAWSATVVAPNVVDPDYVAELPPYGDGADWAIDADAWTATLGRLTLPLDPMLGCFGVAPAGGQAISAETCGAHGGNMDYRGYRAGVTAYFPVFVPGALFHVGDGHARQGDGEVVGSGLEVSMDVEFTVSVLKRESRWPGGETEDAIFTVGNARPLDQALQHATTEMLRRLQSDYGFAARDASTLLGQCVEYDVGNVYNPAHTMVCRLAKRHLP